MRLTLRQVTWLKVVLHLAALLPLLYLVLSAAQGWLSADPAKDIQHFTGRMALKLLLATLLVSPLTRYLKQPLLIRTRRMLGLWCFAWATLHLISYWLLELGFTRLRLLGSGIFARPYLLLGMIIWVVLFALGRRWQTLHNAIYLVAILVPIHYLWSVKVLSPQPWLYALAAALLLAWRYKKLRKSFSR